MNESGLVRSASLRLSLTTLRETFYLGAGAGSVVSNGLPFVWLGNIGLPGTILFVLFFFLVMRGRERLKGQNRADYGVYPLSIRCRVFSQMQKNRCYAA